MAITKRSEHHNNDALNRSPVSFLLLLLCCVVFLLYYFMFHYRVVFLVLRLAGRFLFLIQQLLQSSSCAQRALFGRTCLFRWCLNVPCVSSDESRAIRQSTKLPRFRHRSIVRDAIHTSSVNVLRVCVSNRITSPSSYTHFRLTVWICLEEQ